MIKTANRIASIVEYRINLTPVIDNGEGWQGRAEPLRSPLLGRGKGSL